MHGVFAWYNIGWHASRFNNQSRHERTLAEDLTEAIDELHADKYMYVVLLNLHAPQQSVVKPASLQRALS